MNSVPKTTILVCASALFPRFIIFHMLMVRLSQPILFLRDEAGPEGTRHFGHLQAKTFRQPPQWSSSAEPSTRTAWHPTLLDPDPADGQTAFIPFDAEHMVLARPVRRRLLHRHGEETQGGPRTRRTQPHATPKGGDCNGDICVAPRREGLLYDHGVVPEWFVKLFLARKAYIYMLEVFAQLAAFVTFFDAPAAVDRCRHRQHGGPDSSVQRIWQRSGGQRHDLGVLDSRRAGFVEFERVLSKANVADTVSRDDFTWARREGWTLV